MAGIDINRTTSGVTLPPSVSNEIWQGAQEASAVMQLATRVDLPGNGAEIQVITGDPTANWVNETDEKPVSRGALDTKTMRGYTLAVIEPFSNQFRRDKTALYNALVSRLPGVLATKFDNTVFFGTAPGSDFDTLTGAPTASVENVDGTQTAYDGFLAALASVATNDGNLSGWALSPQGEITALSAKDGNGRPLFTSDLQNEGSIGSILGRPAYRSTAVYEAGTVGTPGTPETVGFGGEWASARWGQVQGVSISISDQATLNDGGTSLNLWQRNMFAVRAEIEIGFITRDVNRFVRLTGATPQA
ncbi:hypothetical protein B1813_18975 [Saccharomonospora piscinae]|uniref:Phage capsid-like C-terminal domain-containing protein n=1 Tax=Saccharomonospora piscinae TaxID=687388 RepID=A0A1V8ZZ16_SACPI|nr:phage major capsid protein [Saccharomonospora piscinae]OQO89924.1 hypothetical protein B1813_18975 [Saccharomonospora piscinae]